MTLPFPATLYPSQLNSVNTTLNGSLAQASTTVTVTTVGNLLPNSSCPYLVMIGPAGGFDTTTEICICTGVSGSVLTITRAAGGSTAPSSWASGSLIACNFSSLHWTNLVTNMNSTAPLWLSLNGVAGTTCSSNNQFAQTPPSTSTITVQLAAAYPVGTPIKYVNSGNTYYGVITACTTSLITIAGIALTTGGNNLTSLSIGDQSRVVMVPILTPGYYESATVSTYINSNLLSPNGFLWELPLAYCVGYTFQTATTDGSSNGYIQLVVNGSAVSSVGASGILINATTMFTSGVLVNTVSSTNITINTGQFFEISVTKGTGGDATNGRLVAIFVIP